MWARTLHDFSFLIHFMNEYFQRLSFIRQTAPRQLECRVSRRTLSWIYSLFGYKNLSIFLG